MWRIVSTATCDSRNNDENFSLVGNVTLAIFGSLSHLCVRRLMDIPVEAQSQQMMVDELTSAAITESGAGRSSHALYN
jgi:hypothetical protein